MHDTGPRDEERRSGPPSEERVRLELVLFAELIQRLERENRLAESLPFVLRRLGDLRRLLFDYEVRATERLLPIEDPHDSVVQFRTSQDPSLQDALVESPIGRRSTATVDVVYDCFQLESFAVPCVVSIEAARRIDEVHITLEGRFVEE